MTENMTLFHREVEINLAHGQGQIKAQYTVDSQNNPKGPVVVSYAPTYPSVESRPGVTTHSETFMRQLLQIPLEVHGVPIEVLIKLANALHQKAGTSVIGEM